MALCNDGSDRARREKRIRDAMLALGVMPDVADELINGVIDDVIREERDDAKWDGHREGRDQALNDRALDDL